MAVSNMRGILMATAVLAVVAIGLAILATIDRFAVARPRPWSRNLVLEEQALRDAASEEEALRDAQLPGMQESQGQVPHDAEPPDWGSKDAEFPTVSRAASWPALDQLLACTSERVRDAAIKSDNAVEAGACDDGTSNVTVGAMEWTRARILIFESRVMTRNIALPGGASAGNTTVVLHSLFPGHTQHGAYAFDKRFSNSAVLAQLGLLLTPFYMFSGTTALQVAGDADTPTPKSASPDRSQFDFLPTARGARMRVREARDAWENLAAKAQQDTGAAIDDASPRNTLQEARNRLGKAWRKTFHSIADNISSGPPDTPTRGTTRRLLELFEQAREAADASSIMQDTEEQMDLTAPKDQQLEDGEFPPEIGEGAAHVPATDDMRGAQMDGGHGGAVLVHRRRLTVDAILRRHVAAGVRAANHAADVAAWTSWSPLAGVAGVFSNASASVSRSTFANSQEPPTDATLAAALLAADGSRLLAFPDGNIESWLHHHVECAFTTMVDPVLHDLDRLRESIESQGKYPLLALPLRARSKRAVRDALVGTAAKQPIPHVLTAFNVMVDARGHLYSSTRLSRTFPIQPSGRAFRVDARRHGDGATVFAQTSFRPTMCLHDSPLSEHSVRKALPSERVLFVDEVIVITQHWGDAMFHFWRECLMRLLLMVDYVRAYKHVRIHVPQSNREEFLVGVDRPGRLIREAFALLDIEPARITTGHVFARIVHVPDGTPCGQPYVLSDLLARELWRRAAGLPAILDVWRLGVPRRSSDPTVTAAAPERSPDCGKGSARSWVVRAQDQLMSAVHGCIAEAEHEEAGIRQQRKTRDGLQLGEDEIPLTPALPQGDAPITGNCSLRVLIIERAPGTRYVKNHFALAGALRSIPGVAVEVFSAHHLPSARETIHMFASADVIVAPHGAGLTNTLFSSPGQVVIELLAREYQTNLVFMQQALALGLQHHAFVPAHAHTDGTILAEIDRVAALVAALAGAPADRSLMAFHSVANVSFEQTSSAWVLAFGVLLMVTLVAIAYVVLSQPSTVDADIAATATAPLQSRGASESGSGESFLETALTIPARHIVETRAGLDHGSVASRSSGGSAVTASVSSKAHTGSHAVEAPEGQSVWEGDSTSWGWGMDDDLIKATTPPRAAAHPALAVMESSPYSGCAVEARSGVQGLHESSLSRDVRLATLPAQESKVEHVAPAEELQSLRAVSSDADWSQVSSNAGESWSDIHVAAASERGISSSSSGSRSPLANNVPLPGNEPAAHAHAGALAPQMTYATVSRDSSSALNEDTAAVSNELLADEQLPPAPRFVSSEGTAAEATAHARATSGWDDWEAGSWE